MKHLITVKETITINAEPAVVWDYTQDYTKRSQWDRSVLHANVTRVSPDREVEVLLRGNMMTAFRYKLFDRPIRSTLTMIHTKSPIFSGGGGSWSYVKTSEGTRWTQVNSLILKDLWLTPLLKPLARIILKRNTHCSMLRAKRIIERR